MKVTARGGRAVQRGPRVHARHAARRRRAKTQISQGDGWATLTLVPNAQFPRPRNGFNVQFFIKAFRSGDPSTRRGRRLPPRAGPTRAGAGGRREGGTSIRTCGRGNGRRRRRPRIFPCLGIIQRALISHQPEREESVVDSDRVEGKVKETEGEIQQKWGEAKDKARDTLGGREGQGGGRRRRGRGQLGRAWTRRRRGSRRPAHELSRDSRPNERGSAPAGRPFVLRLGTAPLRGDGRLRSARARKRSGAFGRSRSASGVRQRSAGEVVLDDDGAHVRRPRDRRRVPELIPTCRITAASVRFASASVSAGPRRSSSSAASSVPPHVRKSFAV